MRGLATAMPCARACLPHATPWDIQTSQLNARDYLVEITVASSGQPTDVHVKEPVTSGPVVECLVATLKRASFPPLANGLRSTFTWLIDPLVDR